MVVGPGNVYARGDQPEKSSGTRGALNGRSTNPGGGGAPWINHCTLVVLADTDTFSGVLLVGGGEEDDADVLDVAAIVVRRGGR
uniref:Uncharacterized protein n=1 Tax=Oryza brachyantha TaxID=4533 RepID=J3N6V0_ORYBR